jgi:hypothetical protein
VTQTTLRPEPRTTALSLIRTTALDHAARHDHDGEEPAPPNWDMCTALTAALEHWRAAGTLTEGALLLTEWLAVELGSYLFQQLGQDKARFEQWLLDFGDQVCQSQPHGHGDPHGHRR